ncbi:MAG: hypothetical protein L6R41_002774 [Letrouitia leprolyta]|nr:MAG: hypothetical protein L6R41_002774 [Letrouitia leprolyta]
MSTAKLLEKRTHQVPGKLLISEYFFEVLLDHANPQHGNLSLFARSVERFERPVGSSRADEKQLPWCTSVIQTPLEGISQAYMVVGGPGMGCKAPQNYGWTERALKKGYQILFLDQRGTGLSSTVTAQTLAKHGGPEEQADYLRHFRADSIGKAYHHSDLQSAFTHRLEVEDCEAIRKGKALEGFAASPTFLFSGIPRVSSYHEMLIPQSPEGLQEAYICAGLAPLVNQPDPVYQSLYTKAAERNRAYYGKYTEDVQRVKNIVHYLQTEDVQLPSGGTLSISRFRQLGIHFGFHGTSGRNPANVVIITQIGHLVGHVDVIHGSLIQQIETILRMANDLDIFGYFTRPTLSQFEGLLPFDTLPLYALVHELLYLQGDNISNWSADRVMKEHPEFMNLSTSNDDPIYFTGEMIYPSMFSAYSELRPLASTAKLLAQMTDWPVLYDEAQLANNTVPVYASAYIDDMYVSFDLAMATARRIRGCKYFVTNTMYHDAISHAGRCDELFRQLFQLRDDCLD